MASPRVRPCSLSLASTASSSTTEPLPRWVPNEASTTCMSCKASFTFLNRRHHCRNCGVLVCGACSTKRAKLHDLPSARPLRVCEGCVGAARLSGGSFVAVRSTARSKASLSILSHTASLISPKGGPLDASSRGSTSIHLMGPPPTASLVGGGPPKSPRAFKELPQDDHKQQHEATAPAAAAAPSSSLSFASAVVEEQQGGALSGLRQLTEVLAESMRQVAAIQDPDERQDHILQLLQALDELEVAKRGLLAAFIASQEESLLVLGQGDDQDQDQAPAS